ncbi:TPMT family class I SAM-dependent methyltransferase [bacterium]|nr:TPMT family class I SAM-dependent methyltransferase [bacterium]
MSAIDWDARYRDGETPWEKGMAHPALPFFVSKHPELFAEKPRLFHPGCGYGHDAGRLAPLCSELTALDLAAEPIARAKALYPAPNIHWEVGDLFAWDEPGKYDLVWEHTCFCAIPLNRRPEYVRAIHALLKTGGFLTGVFFIEPDHLPEEGPPFGVTREELNQLFAEDFELIEDLPNPPTYEGRENRETVMIWQKRI